MINSFKHGGILFFVLLSLANQAKAQLDQKVSLTFKGQKVDAVFKYLENIYPVHFSYSTQLGQEYSISFQCEDLPLKQAINQLMQANQLSHQWAAKNIVIVSRATESTLKKFLKAQQQVFPFSTCGWIKDQNTQEPLAFATIQISGTEWNTIADEKGYFQIKGEAKSSDRLLVNYLGYEEFSLPFNERLV